MSEPASSQTLSVRLRAFVISQPAVIACIVAILIGLDQVVFKVFTLYGEIVIIAICIVLPNVFVEKYKVTYSSSFAVSIALSTAILAINPESRKWMWRQREQMMAATMAPPALALHSVPAKQINTRPKPPSDDTSYSYSVTFSPDGRLALLGGQRGLRLWDVASGALIRSFEGGKGTIKTVAISRDGTMALSGSSDEKTFKLWNVTSGSLIRTFEAWATSVAFSPREGKVLSGGIYKGVKLWDIANGNLILTFESDYPETSVAFSPDGSKVLSGSGIRGALNLWDVASGKLIQTLKGHEDSVMSVVFSPDGTKALSGSGDHTIKLWDIASGSLIRTFEGHGDEVTSVAFSPDGHTILSGSKDSTIILWDVDHGSLIQTFQIPKSDLDDDVTAFLQHIHPRDFPHAVNSVAFSPDGLSFLSAGQDGLNLWKVGSEKPIRHFGCHPCQ